MSKEDNSFLIRPSGRHILTIGRDLIQDEYAAIVELVKNAYDADSIDVIITFKIHNDKLTIIVEDHGHGMTKDTVINKWLVPSTDDKLHRKNSPKGRTMQGRKGVGRYAASILGSDLLMETVSESGMKTEVYLVWENFINADFLDQVEILVNSVPSKEKTGTKLTMNVDTAYYEYWNYKNIKTLEYELKKLVTPVSQNDSGVLQDDEFEIYLKFENFWEEDDLNCTKKIDPFPILELYDYKISGNVNSDGKGKLYFHNQKAKNTLTETIEFDYEQPTHCGNLTFDIRVYDREKEAIELLIERGLKDEDGNYLGKMQTRQLLNSYNGIGVYRNGFRIRPLGDPDFDWLKLNEARIQNPSQRIGSNQVIGFVQVESEEKSHLEEKSARDGLKENNAYAHLKKISENIIDELETRRFSYRKKAGLSRAVVKIERQLEELFIYDDIKKSIQKTLYESGVSKETTEKIINIVNDKAEKNNLIIDNIRRAVAVYQGQATLGKIINVILHEGRRPLNYFKNQIPNLSYWAKSFIKTNDEKSLNEIIPIALGLETNATIFANLFGRLDPLASGKRGPKKKYNLLNILETSLDVFKNELKENEIICEITSSADIELYGWEEDLYIIITNLIDNSIFWITNKPQEIKTISINVITNNGIFQYIDIKDSGPGIAKHLIEDQLIFDPEFSTKNKGSGLGLSISGEAANRNGLELIAFESDEGAYFRLQNQDRGDEDE